MLGLFGKKEGKDPWEKLAGCQRKKDWVALFGAYYELGRDAMENGKPNSANLWLCRADTIYSAKDETFEKAEKKRLFRPAIADDCSERIGKLEDAPLLYNTLPAEIEEKAETLRDLQVRVWGLLSMARMVKLGERLAGLPGCGVLGRLGWAVDMMVRSFQTPPGGEAYQQLMDVCNELYELGDSEDFYAGGEIEVPDGAPFQVFDLNGMGVLLELNGYLDGHLRLLAALSQDEELPSAEPGVIACALLPDYYVRTRGEQPEDVPQIQAELRRIGSDYQFVCSNPDWPQVEQRLAAYKALDILA